MRTWRKGTGVDDPNYNYSKTLQLKSLNISLCLTILWVRNLEQGSSGDPSAPWDINWGHNGSIQLAAVLSGESSTD